jgi:hypothetical protein
MYTTPRFLEFAKQFLNLKFDTKKAESEFEKIEQQDRHATEQSTFVPVDFNYADYVAMPTPQWAHPYAEPLRKVFRTSDFYSEARSESLAV